MAAPDPHLSIVIPVYNEEGILRGSVLELREKLRPFGFSYELVLCENGSRDRTMELGKELEWDAALNSKVEIFPKVLAWDADPGPKPGANGFYARAIPGKTAVV